MARTALGLFCLVLLLGGSGCTWTEAYRDYPPGVEGKDTPIHAHHDPGPIAK